MYCDTFAVIVILNLISSYFKTHGSKFRDLTVKKMCEALNSICVIFGESGSINYNLIINHCLISTLALGRSSSIPRSTHERKKLEFKQLWEYIGHLKSIWIKLMIYNNHKNL